jgi:hypothetical protein
MTLILMPNFSEVFCTYDVSRVPGMVPALELKKYTLNRHHPVTRY